MYVYYKKALIVARLVECFREIVGSRSTDADF